jgi:hypothetical protein
MVNRSSAAYGSGTELKAQHCAENRKVGAQDRALASLHLICSETAPSGEMDVPSTGILAAFIRTSPLSPVAVRPAAHSLVYNVHYRNEPRRPTGTDSRRAVRNSPMTGSRSPHVRFASEIARSSFQPEADPGAQCHFDCRSRPIGRSLQDLERARLVEEHSRALAGSRL